MSSTSGYQQSPIDIDRTDVTRREVAPIEVRYPTDPAPVDIRLGVADGDETGDGTIIVPQVVVTPSASDAHVMVDGSRFDLQSFHWHSPSEHLFDGRTLPLELHLVHASSDGDLLVLGVLSETGSADAAIVPVFTRIPDLWLGGGSLSATMRLADLVPPGDAFRYEGSLTTAPFSSGVSWLVCANAATASAEQITAHLQLVSAAIPGFEGRPHATGNARRPQLFEGRVEVTGIAQV
jgi:carbonic anhydrase